MLNKIKNRDTKGFTIIEVMIVLAIAGLILLIVFLAIPALQRNSRNTQRKNDVARMSSAINEYVSNNNGQLPSSAPTWSAPTIKFNGGTSAETNIGFYTTGIGTAQGNVTENLSTASGGVAALAGTAADDRVVINNGGSCGAAGAVTQGNPRSVAIQYEIESGNGTYTATCQS